MRKSELDFRALRYSAGFPRLQDAAEFLGVSTKTIKNWDKNGAPIVAIRALEYRAGIAEGWKDFLFRAGNVSTPANEIYNSVEVHQIKYFNVLCYNLGRDHCKLPEKLGGEKVVDLARFKIAKTSFIRRKES